MIDDRRREKQLSDLGCYPTGWPAPLDRSEVKRRREGLGEAEAFICLVRVSE